MKRLLAALVLVVTLASVGAVASIATAAPPSTEANLSVPITASDADQSFVGTFTLDRFASQGGELVAVGTVSGTVTNTLTGISQTVGPIMTTLDVIDISATCEILHLELGPLDLNLLGLVVHLDRIVLDITAESGPGNLLGNLLCGIAGLLDQNGVPLNRIVNLLNQILALL